MASTGFPGGFPTESTVTDAYDRADSNRAVACYRYFYPAVSGMMIARGTLAAGVEYNRVFGTLDTRPLQVGFTLNSDTPYGPMLLDLSVGPLVVEVPQGPIIAAFLALDQRWVADMGLPGPDAGKGGSYLLLPPGHDGEVPEGYFVARSSTFHVVGGVRAIPVDGDVPAALRLLTTVKVHPLDPSTPWEEPTWIDLTGKPQDTTPVSIERSIEFWRVLHDFISTEPALEEARAAYGDLAALGIEKGTPFDPDERLQRILAAAAEDGNDQLRVQSFADRRPDRSVWSDRHWEWVTLRPENGFFQTPGYTDTVAREVWFFQAIATSPAMFRRQAGFGSLYWFGARDDQGDYLDGSRAYRLEVPLPVPANLFWSVTVYDAETRSQIQTDQGYAALRSMFELRDAPVSDSVALHFGPEQPDGDDDHWIRTIPGRGWFAYFRVYGPQTTVFDGTWRPGDFTAAE
ncbi:DUF1254 domain-containing protein [Leifsonia aquatica]|uniref:DUF1254 domain-containing protein n=1 Tax=Leifsonia aquatica TaxID=144185 RepID=UPI00046971D0|nr:DUF1254 domain-containing protein [Leifsonia aquatica]